MTNLTEDILYFWLSLSSATIYRKNKALEMYDVQELYSKVGADEELQEFFGAEHYEELIKLKSCDYLERNLDEAYKKGIKFVSRVDKRYPSKLRKAEVVPPLGLYYKGNLDLLSTKSVAIVGTRNASAYGREVAERFAQRLSENSLTVVSGLATGIDAYAHAQTLKSGGNTVAVLGSGLNKPTPMSNYALFGEICEKGLVVSEYPINTVATKYTFPERNRIVSALSEASIIVEAAKRSGALITADKSLEQGKHVFAVPGNITSPKSEGTNNLIKKGCRILTSIDDILSVLNIKNTNNNKNTPAPMLDFFEQRVYNLLQNGEKTVNELADIMECTIPQMLNIAMSMNLKGVLNWKYNNLLELRG